MRFEEVPKVPEIHTRVQGYKGTCTPHIGCNDIFPTVLLARNLSPDLTCTRSKLSDISEIGRRLHHVYS